MTIFGAANYINIFNPMRKIKDMYFVVRVTNIKHKSKMEYDAEFSL